MSQLKDIFGPIASLARAAAMTVPSETTESRTSKTGNDSNRGACECDGA